MKEYTSYEIQEISSNFRSVARRLSRTDYSQCDANLKRFIGVLKQEEIISEFISTKNTVNYDIPAIIKARQCPSPFEVSPVQEEEISFSVQLLNYAVDAFDGNFTRLYGTHIYTSYKSTTNDEMRKFIEHIIDPLIDYISEYLRHCYDKAKLREGLDKPTHTPNVNAHNSTIVIGSTVSGDVSNKVSITENEKQDAGELINAIRAVIEEEKPVTKNDIEDLLKQIKEEIDIGKKPAKGLLVALKVLCQAGTIGIPFVTALMEMFA